MLQVRLLGEQSDIFKHIRKDSNKWEVARPPNEVRACTRCHTLDTCTFSRSIRGGRALPPGHMQVTIEAWRQGGKGAALLAKHAMHPTSRKACVHAGWRMMQAQQSSSSAIHLMVEQALLTLPLDTDVPK